MVYHIQWSSEIPKIICNYISHVIYLQEASSRGANMCYGLVLYGCDQQRCEEDVCHLPVEEVHSVVRLGHHSWMISACGIVLHALTQGT